MSASSSRPVPANLRTSHPHAADRLDCGVVLIDTTLRTIAADSGAARILASSDHESRNSAAGIRAMPEEILGAIRDWHHSGVPLSSLSVRIGERSYRCRLYGIVSDEALFAPAIVAVTMESGAAASDPIRRLAAEHHLTEREEEALHGIALGLSTKELADRMNISPNTVKSFVRLIMIKLGVTSRAAIMVKLLESSPSRNV